MGSEPEKKRKLIGDPRTFTSAAKPREDPPKKIRLCAACGEAKTTERICPACTADGRVWRHGKSPKPGPWTANFIRGHKYAKSLQRRQGYRSTERLRQLTRDLEAKNSASTKPEGED